MCTTVLNLCAAVLVAVQKFFMFEEKAALHEAIKDEYFDVIAEENFLVGFILVRIRVGQRRVLVDIDCPILTQCFSIHTCSHLSSVSQRIHNSPHLISLNTLPQLFLPLSDFGCEC